MATKILMEKKFKSRVVSENSFGIAADYGVRENVMKLYQGKSNLFIEWVVFGADGESIDGAEIGIWTAGKKVTDYDGVFELPKEAVALLNEYGLDTKEVTEA